MLNKEHNKSYNVGLIGYGRIGKRHAQCILENPHFNLVAVADINPNVLSEINGDIRKYGSIEDLLLNSGDIDIISIATPNGFHYFHAVTAMKLGKHVVIEKPMALTESDALSLLDEAKSNGVKIFPVMQNRYSPPSKWLKEIVSSGVLGKIYLVEVNCFWNRDFRYYTPGSWHGNKELDGGTLYTQFSHFIDLIYWCFGEFTNISSRFKNFNHKDLIDFEDSGCVTFDFINGGFGVFTYSTSVWDKNFESCLKVVAENGTIKIGGQYIDTVEYVHVKNYQMPKLDPTAPGNNYGSYVGSAANHHLLYQNIAEYLMGQESLLTEAEEESNVVKLIENIYKSQTEIKNEHCI